MNWLYPTKYSDRRGVELAELRNDGRNLSIKLRGVSFSGAGFDALEPEADSSADELSRFTICNESLCDCRLDCEIPIFVVLAGETVPCTLHMHLELGAPAANGGLDRELLSLSVDLKGEVCQSAGTGGFFENELLSLQAALPPSSYLKACMSCAHSDYSPFGHGLFGGMACFRTVKEQYAKVKSKQDLFRIWGEAERVQETFLCPEFERRRPNTGYRG